MNRVLKLSCLVLLGVAWPTQRLEAELCRSSRYPKLILDSRLILNAEALIDESRGLGLRLNNSYRSSDEQEALYKAWINRGRTGNPVARPGLSRHEFGFALDLNGLQPLTFHQWNGLLNTGEKYGFTYILGDFPDEGNRNLDWPHFEADPRDYGITPARALRDNRRHRDSVRVCMWAGGATRVDSATLESGINVSASIDSAHPRITRLTGEVSSELPESLSSVVVRVEVANAYSGVTCVRFVELIEQARPIAQSERRTFRVPIGHGLPCRGGETFAIKTFFAIRSSLAGQKL